MAFSPLDEELELLAGKLTPWGHERLVELSSYMPFEQAVELFEDFTGIHVSKDVGQRYTEEAGAVYEELQAEEVEEIQKKRPKTSAMSGKLQVSADGCMVPLLHGVWAEVKTLVIGEVQPAVLKAGERVVRTRNLSYFSRKTGSEEFERLSLGEMHRRGVENAKAVAAVMDGPSGYKVSRTTIVQRQCAFWTLPTRQNTSTRSESSCMENTHRKAKPGSRNTCMS